MIAALVAAWVSPFVTPFVATVCFDLLKGWMTHRGLYQSQPQARVDLDNKAEELLESIVRVLREMEKNVVKCPLIPTETPQELSQNIAQIERTRRSTLGGKRSVGD